MLSLRIFSRLLTLTLVAACTPDRATVPVRPGGPAVEITELPQHGTFQDLKGQCWNIQASAYKIAVVIFVRGRHWTKPLITRPSTSIAGNGSWICDVTTGGEDHLATEFAVFLVPSEFVIPLLSGEVAIPQVLFEAAVSYVQVTRPPTLALHAGDEFIVSDLVSPTCHAHVADGASVSCESESELHCSTSNSHTIEPLLAFTPIDCSHLNFASTPHSTWHLSFAYRATTQIQITLSSSNCTQSCTSTVASASLVLPNTAEWREMRLPMWLWETQNPTFDPTTLTVPFAISLCRGGTQAEVFLNHIRWTRETTQ